jgi:hypothetical protein
VAVLVAYAFKSFTCLTVLAGALSFWRLPKLWADFPSIVVNTVLKKTEELPDTVSPNLFPFTEHTFPRYLPSQAPK